MKNLYYHYLRTSIPIFKVDWLGNSRQPNLQEQDLESGDHPIFMNREDGYLSLAELIPDKRLICELELPSSHSA